jgi:hypothetical protein
LKSPNKQDLSVDNLMLDSIKQVETGAKFIKSHILAEGPIFNNIFQVLIEYFL